MRGPRAPSLAVTQREAMTTRRMRSQTQSLVAHRRQSAFAARAQCVPSLSLCESSLRARLAALEPPGLRDHLAPESTVPISVKNTGMLKEHVSSPLLSSS